MAIGAQADFEMHSGDHRDLVVTVKDEAGALVDISGATMRWHLSKLDSSGSRPGPKGAALVQKSVGSGIVLTTPASGVATVSLLPADTASLAGEFYHELEMVLGGKTSTVLFGKVTVLKDLVE